MLNKFLQKITNSITKLIYDYRSFEIIELSFEQFHILEIFDFRFPKDLGHFKSYDECLNYIEKLYEESLLKEYKIESSIDVLSKVETFKVLKKSSNQDITDFIKRDLYIRGEFYSYEDILQNLKIYFKNQYTFKIKKNMKIKIVKNVGENIKAFEEVNKYPLLGSLFTEFKQLCTFDWLTPNKKIVEILQELYFERIKKTLTYKEVFHGGVEEILVYQGSNLISERDQDYGRAENLKTMEDVEKHIRNWFIKGLKIEFPERNIY